MEKYFFPYEKKRLNQEEFMDAVYNAFTKKGKLIVHAPTGLGKTICVLAPGLRYALENNKTIVFLTSRHTQQEIVLRTVEEINKKFGRAFSVAPLRGKMTMCLQDVEKLSTTEFYEFCSSLINEDACMFYKNAKDGSPKQDILLKRLLASPSNAQEIVEEGKAIESCPYEIAMELASKSLVIVADYYYIFNKPIREAFTSKTGKKLEDILLVIDEGHNLAERVRTLSRNVLSSTILKRAANEAEESFNDALPYINKISEAIKQLAKGDEPESIVPKEQFVNLVGGGSYGNMSYDNICIYLQSIGEHVRKKKRTSAIGAVGRFLEAWRGPDEGHYRILSKLPARKETHFELEYGCLDPSLITKEIISQTHSTILMSGTLLPTYMYKEIFGFPEDTQLCEFPSSFPPEKRRYIALLKTSTNYEKRNNEQYEAIAEICKRIINAIPGNTALFFPSYEVMNQVKSLLEKKIDDKILFVESQNMPYEKKEKILDELVRNDNGILLANSAGSFGEGIDLPSTLKGAIVVGIPLAKPSLKTNELIKYYKEKFKSLQKGNEYGYIIPAITKSMQNVGRCIRSESDYAVHIFLDERWGNDRYGRYLPKDWLVNEVKDINDVEKEIEAFFKQQSFNSKFRVEM
ncbi:MAG: ATP-dependent DNA helicase [Candidatus Woesearchaeota archaeon]